MTLLRHGLVIKRRSNGLQNGMIVGGKRLTNFLLFLYVTLMIYESKSEKAMFNVQIEERCYLLLVCYLSFDFCRSVFADCLLR
jgi:hypothetical protein